MSNDFSWTDDTDAVAFKSVRGIAVYANPAGDLVIRQQAGPLDDDDAIIVVPVDRMLDLIDALHRASSDTGHADA